MASFAESFFGGLAQHMIQKNRDQELLKAYQEMKNAESQANIQPFQNRSDAAAEQLFRAKVVNEGNRTAAANMAGLSNPDYLRSLGMTEDEIGTPQMSKTQTNFINNANTGLAQSVKYENAANFANKQAADALVQARQRYSSDIPNSLSPYAGKVPSATLIQMAEALDKSRRETEDRLQAGEIMKLATHPELTDQQRIALYASNPNTMAIAEKIAGRNPQQQLHVTPGSFVQQPDGSWMQVGQQQPLHVTPGSYVQLPNGSFVQIGQPTSGQLTEYQRYKINNGLVGSKTAKLGKNEQWAQNYELNGYHSDQATIDQYNEADELEKPKLQKAAEAAMGRMNQYWSISSGGAYNPGSGTTAASGFQATLTNPGGQPQAAGSLNNTFGKEISQEGQDDSLPSQFIRQAKAEGWSRDQIVNALHSRGITQYDSYVW